MSAEAATIADIRAAAERLAGRAVRTPLLEAPLLSRAVGKRVLVKAECLQRTGSFKFRGAWSALSGAPRAEIENGVLAYSSGNHAQGVAHAAELLGVPATIVMPEDAPALKKANTAAYGATVVTYDRAGGASREDLGAELIEERGLRLVRPYDDPLVIAGQGTAGLEIAEQAAARGVTEADVAVCCGGGGLAAGVALALEAEAPGLRVRPVEPEHFDDWGRSQAAGARRTNPRPTGSICDAILTPTPGELTWPIGRRLFGPALWVTDADVTRAMAAAFRQLKIVVAPGGAAALAAALFRPEAFERDVVIAIATGGNVDMEAYRAWVAFERWSAEGLPLKPAA